MRPMNLKQIEALRLVIESGSVSAPEGANRPWRQKPKKIEVLLLLLHSFFGRLLGCLLGSLLRRHGYCHLLLADSIDSPGSRVLR